jgi:hypothetical protein
MLRRVWKDIARKIYYPTIISSNRILLRVWLDREYALRIIVHSDAAKGGIEGINPTLEASNTWTGVRVDYLSQAKKYPFLYGDPP